MQSHSDGTGSGMRFVLILLTLGLLAALAWFVAMRGLEAPYLRGAPQIEANLHAATGIAVGPLAGGQITVETDGQHVTLAGPVASDAERDQVLAAVEPTPLLRRLSDAMVVLPSARPFTFEATKRADGGIALSGHVPTRAAEEALLAQARTMAAGATVEAQLTLAAGAPEGDWQGLAGTGLSALALLEEGRFAVSDLDAALTGDAAGVETAEAVQALLAPANGDWTVELRGIMPLADPYSFRALRTVDGAVIMDGHAPDEATAAALTEAAGRISAEPVAGALTLARGMPGAAWPETIRRGLEALSATRSGLLEVTGGTVAFSADVETIEDEAALRARLDEDWQVEITVLNPPPLADVSILLKEDGTLAATGRMPEGFPANLLAAALPELVLGEMITDEPGVAVDWAPALEGLNIVLPRFRTANVRLLDHALRLKGTLRRGFSAEGSSAALRSVLGRDWDLDLEITESAPLAELILSKRGPEIALSGVLPLGVEPPEAVTAFGPDAGGEGLTTGGEGEADGWRTSLGATAEAMRYFSDVTGQVANGKLELDGRLHPGYGANQVQEWLSARLAEGWSAGLTAEESAASEGDARISLSTGETELFRRGFWLPEMSFPVSEARCADEANAALASGKIRFVTGSARIDQTGRALLNRLSAVAIRCLNSSTLRLEIGGHTDSVGNDEANQKLSEARARAVLEALAARGVRLDAMAAMGYGESQPIASNDVPEGRAENRRITFAWTPNGE